MESQTKSKYTSQVFTHLMKKVFPDFTFPGGAVSDRCVEACLASLQARCITVGRERIVDFCICQVYALSRFGEDYLRRWKVNHSFGPKALERYALETSAHRYYQDKWLTEHSLSRKGLMSLFGDRSQHPLGKFIFPEYEESTKRRQMGTQTGFYICQVSTLLWTPFSGACAQCPFSEKCRERTRSKYHELYRLRICEDRERRSHDTD